MFPHVAPTGSRSAILLADDEASERLSGPGRWRRGARLTAGERGWPSAPLAWSGPWLGCCCMSDREPLIGGSGTQGIVRFGDTVRRPLRPFSLTVQAYLAHLREAGFTGAPLPLGVDEQGREVLSFVPGEVHRHPLPPGAAGDDVLVALARLIRTLHEASAGWVPPPGAVWGGTPTNAGQITERAELVSHRDYATGNVVFRDGLPAALIDFDLAMPTTRLYDIANALWYWAPFKWGDPRDRAPALADAALTCSPTPVSQLSIRLPPADLRARTRASCRTSCS